MQIQVQANMARVVLGLGSNVGDRIENLSMAVQALGQVILSMKLSSCFETAPMYKQDQPFFINAALMGETQLGPLALLQFAKSLEAQIGRRTSSRFGPREIDIDILAFGSLQLHSSGVGIRDLNVPHQLTPERRFVLEPVAELDQAWVFPGFGTAIDLLNATKGKPDTVVRIDHAALSVYSNKA